MILLRNMQRKYEKNKISKFVLCHVCLIMPAMLMAISIDSSFVFNTCPHILASICTFFVGNALKCKQCKLILIAILYS